MKIGARRKTTGDTTSAFMLVLVLGLTQFLPTAWAQALVKSVDAVGMTVSDMDRSVEFFR